MIVGVILLLIVNLQKDLPIIYSQIDKSGDTYESSIEKYKTNEFWGSWSMPLSNAIKAYSIKKDYGKIYPIKNAQDYNLNTAWVARINNSTQNPSIEFKFNFPQNTGYAGAYQFKGICNIFNGYCKSLNTWEQNARVKMLKVYYNNKAICYVTLADTWHFQSFDLSNFFKNRRAGKNLKAYYEIKNGDKLRFEIIEIFKGEKFNDAAISEFLCEGGTN